MNCNFEYAADVLRLLGHNMPPAEVLWGRSEVPTVLRLNGFRAHEIGGIVSMVEQHRARFQEAWDEHFG